VIATGFDHSGLLRGGARDRARRARTRDVTIDDVRQSSLEIRDDEIDIPSFLKDR
jgi:cell division protein FtsZ